MRGGHQRGRSLRRGGADPPKRATPPGGHAPLSEPEPSLATKVPASPGGLPAEGGQSHRGGLSRGARRANTTNTAASLSTTSQSSEAAGSAERTPHSVGDHPPGRRPKPDNLVNQARNPQAMIQLKSERVPVAAGPGSKSSLDKGGRGTTRPGDAHRATRAEEVRRSRRKETPSGINVTDGQSRTKTRLAVPQAACAGEAKETGRGRQSKRGGGPARRQISRAA